MLITLDITKAEIFRPRTGMDEVNLFPRVAPDDLGDAFILTFKTPKGKAEETLAGLFPGVEYTLFVQPAHEYKFSRE